MKIEMKPLQEFESNIDKNKQRNNESGDLEEVETEKIWISFIARTTTATRESSGSGILLRTNVQSEL